MLQRFAALVSEVLDGQVSAESLRPKITVHNHMNINNDNNNIRNQ